jgi:predicted nucleotide-binding protein
MPPSEAAAKINERITKGEEFRSREPRTEADLESTQHEYETWSDYNVELLRRLFTTDKYAEQYSFWGAGVIRMHPSFGQQLNDFRQAVGEKIQRLVSIRERLELIPVTAGVSPSATPAPRPHTNKAFVVHGHDDAARESVARFLETLGIEAVILHEKATEGRTVVEKLEHYSDVDFAVVLLTPDDVGASKREPNNLQPRARQNVVIELGYFVGRLGRKKVCTLFKGPLELPSDYLGVVYVPLDDGGGWRLQLAKELRGAGFQVDMNLAI